MMYIIKIAILVVLLIVGLACSNSDNNSCEYIDIESALVDIKELTVMDIGESVSYVSLETTEESLIGKRAYVRMLKDKLLVGSFQQPIKMFDKRTGKFIQTIGNIGQGANEYTLQHNIPVFWIDDAAEIIYVQTEGNRVLRFDVNGNPLNNINLPDSFPRLTTVSQITTENKLYVYKQTLFNKLDYKILMYDILNGKIHNFFFNEDEILPSDFSQTPISFSGFGNIPVSTSCLIFTLKDGRMVFSYTENPCLWVFDKNVYCKEHFNDTIYQVLENKMEPRLVFNLGDKHCDYKDRYNLEGSVNKITIDYVLEGKECLFFVFQMNYYNLQDAKTYWGSYNKKNKLVKVTDKLHILDSVNGIFLENLQTATSDGQLVGLIEATSCIEKMRNKKTFDISEDSNPIVVIVK